VSSSVSTVESDRMRIFLDRYALRGPDGSLLESSPEQAWRRVAAAVAAVEPSDDRAAWEERFYEVLSGYRFVPGGRILAAMGSGAGVTAQNCYVIPSPEDSRGGIIKSLYEWVEIQSRGGGVGINLSTLRPAGSYVRGVNGTSSGPVSWATMFADASQVIIQGGSRRGAAMIMLDVDHPDVLEFISAKETPGRLEGCNMSVCISDEFMAAVRDDADWELRWGGRTFRTVRAREIWDRIIRSAWASGEPGVYFMGRANAEANSAYFETLISTNPCGEQPLGPYGACLLGAMNLKAYIRGGAFDWEAFGRDVAVAVRFNDNVIDASAYPLSECRESQRRIRRMGIGVMGLADALIELGMRYGSPEAIEFTGDVFRSLRDSAYEASALLAAERGPFPEFDAERYLDRPFIRRLPERIRGLIAEHGIRNCYLLTQAPTGTTSMLAGVNGGIEPYFDFRYRRVDRTGEHLVLTPYAAGYYADGGTGERLPLPDPIYVTANEVTPREHVLMQAAAQRYVDSSISKTANMPESATVDDVRELYELAYSEGLKSLTVYRDRSRQTQVLYREERGEARSARRPLPRERRAITHKFRIGEQEGYLTVGMYDDGTPGEIFTRTSKQGSTISGLLDTISMLASFCLQYGVPLDTLVEKMSGIVFEPAGRTDNPDIPFATSIPDYIFRYLGMRFGDGASRHESSLSGSVCPRCGQVLRVSEGCSVCPSCSYERCG